MLLRVRNSSIISLPVTVERRDTGERHIHDAATRILRAIMRDSAFPARCFSRRASLVN